MTESSRPGQYPTMLVAPSPCPPSEVVPPGGLVSSSERDRRFRLVYAENFGYVVHSLRRLGVSERDLEDVAHDLFVTVHRKLDSYDPAKSLRAWLFAFSVRCASAYRRRAHNRHERVQEAPDPIDTEPPADETLATEQRRRLVQLALDQVGDERRAVFVMHDIDGHRMPEVAETLGIPLNTGYSRLRVARTEFIQAVRSLRGDQP
jgi:RNA polymerase sigma-70 factor, ECF subfamily